MIKKIKIQRWIPSLITALALAGSAGLCQAQSVITYDFASGLQGWSGNEPTNFPATYSWNATNGSTGGGCMQVVFGYPVGTAAATNEMDPWVTLPSTLNELQYLSVSIHMKVDPSSGVTGNLGSGGYGNLQAIFRDASESWDSIWHGAVYSPAGQSWVTYTFVIPQPYKTAEKYLQFQFQGNAAYGYTAPVTVYIDNVTITPLPNPWLMVPFTDGSLISGAWDQIVDAPYVNPVTKGAPVNITPPGSWMITISNPNGYSGWNQIAPPTFDATRYQNIGFDVYFDGPSGGTEDGGFQFFMFSSVSGVWSSHWVGAKSFNSSMIGQWTHFDFPCAAGGITACPAFVFQGAPGSDGGTNAITFHVDNIVLWSPVTIPSIVSLTPGTPGGVQISVDADGTANNNDQEGITSPSADNALYDFFWINQTPASYSFTLTNFAAPAAAFASTPTAPASVGAGFDAHVYLVNGDSIVAAGQNWGYNQTYSGVPFNALDYLGLHVQNASVVDTVTYVTNGATITTNNSYTLGGGVVAIIDWKTNAPNFNATNRIVFNFPSMASANGTWSLNFSDNTHGNIVAADGSVNSFTLPDFYSDPNYTANFTPATSLVQFGVFKNGNNANNNLSTIFSHVSVSDANGTIYNDSFNGTNLTSEYAWQVAEYYLDAADRAIWIPQNTGWWIKWNATVSGWSVQSTSNLLGNWSNAGVTYTYVDGTGTNTLGAIPAASLPAGNAAFFRLVK
jgi:hypothetical protein